MKIVRKDKESANLRTRTGTGSAGVASTELSGQLLESEEILEGRMVASHFDPNSPAGGNFGRAKVRRIPRLTGDQLEIEVGGVPIPAWSSTCDESVGQLSA